MNSVGVARWSILPCLVRLSCGATLGTAVVVTYGYGVVVNLVLLPPIFSHSHLKSHTHLNNNIIIHNHDRHCSSSSSSSSSEPCRSVRCE